ncbi:hypothetical protein [Streptomyces sp. NPDC088707]|uniref:hypothetical protein n=1 Tax=Streptomyces sp. NPDC088707 TaxID=3365871 RepID=UPI0038193A54
MSTAAPPAPTIPRRVRLDAGQPASVDLLVLLAARDRRRTRPRTKDVVYSFETRTHG